MRILKLKLRGAIGIKKGLGVDEIEIDFTQFQPGLIALTGRNGSGKTSILEQLHPYRQMVSRDGSLQSHFFLKDSYRVLNFEINEIEYSSTILIDALTGASEAYLAEYQSDGSIKPLNDGKLTTYDEAIEKLLGTPELFFNSVFSGQKSKGIAELKPADRRKLFYELLNLNSYEVYLEGAKKELRDQEFKLAKVEGELSAISDQQSKSIEDLEQDRFGILDVQKSLTDEIGGLEIEISAFEENIKEFEIKIRTSEEKLKGNEEIETRLAVISDEINSLDKNHNSKMLRYNSEIEDNQKLIERDKKLIENKEQVNKSIEIIGQVSSKYSNMQIILAELQKLNSQKQNEYSTKLQKISLLEKELTSNRSNKEQSELEQTHIQKEITRIQADTKIIGEVPCGDKESIISKYDFSKCKFLINAYSSKEQLYSLEEQDKSLGIDIEDFRTKIIALEKKIETDKQILVEKFEIQLKENTATLNEKEQSLKQLKTQLDELNKTDWQKLKSDSLEAESNIKLLEQKIENIRTLVNEAVTNFAKELERLKTEAGDLQKKLDIELPKKIADLKEDLSKDRMDLGNKNSLKNIKREQYDDCRAELVKVDQEIESVNQSKERIAVLNDDKKKVEDEIRDWTFLCKAFDKTGIPVLKLENSGIEITSIANELLSLFENKFRIVFETTSLTKDKKKMKETFDINIVEEDGVCEIGNKSGGQQVWIETAIQLAIMILLSQQGKKSETAFLDEKDGALDLDNAYAYIEMIKKAHQMSGVYNTFVITHRTELLDFIPQQVKLNNGILEIMN